MRNLAVQIILIVIFVTIATSENVGHDSPGVVNNVDRSKPASPYSFNMGKRSLVIYAFDSSMPVNNVERSKNDPLYDLVMKKPSLAVYKMDSSMPVNNVERSERSPQYDFELPFMDYGMGTGLFADDELGSIPVNNFRSSAPLYYFGNGPKVFRNNAGRSKRSPQFDFGLSPMDYGMELRSVAAPGNNIRRSTRAPRPLDLGLRKRSVEDDKNQKI